MACKGQSGFFNPIKAFNCLNTFQKEEDPEAYEPNIVKYAKALQEKQELIEKEREIEQERKQLKAKEIDQTLFDFDEDIDNLEEVDERYPAQFTQPMQDGNTYRDKEEKQP